jgi:TRAP-type C4-dicarboxylate transport system permease small subunit
VLLCGLLAWFSVRFAWQSHVFHDISTGNDATPLWIPQLSMAIGSVILLIAMVDELVTELRHGPRDRLSAEPIRSE